MLDCGHYTALATVMEFPGPDFPSRVEAVRDQIRGDHPAAARQLEAFLNLLPRDADGGFSDAAMEACREIFTRSFDVQSMTTLDVGYVMFGDDYKRAELMVNLNREHQEVGIDCGMELPDHLPNVLRLLAVWKNPALVTEFVQEILHLSLAKMIDEFEDKRVEQRNVLYKKHFKTLIDWDPDRATMYREALGAVLSVLHDDFTLAEIEERPETSQFLSSIGREMDIEERGEGQRNTTPVPTGADASCPQPMTQLPQRRTP